MERTSQYPIRRYRKVRDFLAAEQDCRTVSYVCKVEVEQRCPRCGKPAVTNLVREERKTVAQLPGSRVVEPLGEVNVWTQPDGAIRVRATILMVPNVAGAETGLAIDGSASMKGAFGGEGSCSALFGATSPNTVEAVARTVAERLASFSSSAKTDVVYWACGPDGSEIEAMGEVNASSAKRMGFPGPRQYGTGTKLLPVLKYFTEKAGPRPSWSLFVIVTDGIVEDLLEVQQYSEKLAKQLASGARGFLKLVLIGVGAEVDEAQMDALDELDYGGLKMPTGERIDLWDHKLASEMRNIDEIFAEVVSEHVIVASSGEILDCKGMPAKPLGRGSYKDGLPALLEFLLPANSKAFTLVLPDGKQVIQRLA